MQSIEGDFSVPSTAVLQRVTKVGLLIWALVFHPAFAATGDTFQPYLSYSYSHDDNLFRLPDSQIIATGKSDTYQTAQGGITVDKSVSMQHLTASLNLSRTAFDQYKQLNNDGKDIQANWNWHIGNHLQGNLGTSYTQALTPYTEFHNTEKNLRTQKRDYFDAGWRFHPSWSLHGGYSQFKLDYDLATQKFGDRTEDTSELGLDYLAASDSTVGMLMRHTKGGFPTPQLIGPLVVDNSYTQNEYKGKVDWLFSGKTHLQFLGGWVQRKHASFPARDTSGPGLRVIADWLATGKTAINLTAWREIYASDDLTASYTLNKGISLAPKWDMSTKVRMEGLFKVEKRDFGNATAFTTLLPNRQDTSRYASLTLTYFAFQNLQISGSVFRDTLKSNIPLSDFHAKGMTLSLRSVF